MLVNINDYNNKRQTTRNQTFAKPSPWEKRVVSDNISQQAKSEKRGRVSVMGKENSTSHPDSKHTPFYYYYFLPNDSAHYETFILSFKHQFCLWGHCSCSSMFLAICLLKVFVCKMNCCTGRRDDSLHEDDIELISEMLQNGLVDVYHET